MVGPLMTEEKYADGDIGLNVWDGEDRWERFKFKTREEFEIKLREVTK
jgi:hypothetical protein